jgi:diguanylate cyclase (GGDEF)-like protein
VDHAVAVLFLGKRFDNCRILNFSLSGLYLRCTDGQFDGSGNSQKEHALLDVPVTGSDGNSLISLGVKVIYVAGDGMGVEFFKPQDKLIQHLRDTSRRAGPRDEQKASAARQDLLNHPRRTQMLERLEQISRRFMQRELPGFLALSEARLLEVADKALPGSQQAEIFHGLSAIEKNHPAIIGNLLGQLADSLRDRTQEKPAQRPDRQKPNEPELALVGKEDFNEWVVIVGIARTLDQQFGDSLQSLNQVLGRFLRVPPDNESNPFSPYSLLWLLQKPMQQRELSETVKQVVYNAYRDSLLLHADQLYDELLEYLAQQGITSAAVAADKRQSAQTADPKTTVNREQRRKNVLQTLSSMLPFRSTDANENISTGPAEIANRQDVMARLETMPIPRGRSVLQQLEQQLARQSDSGGAAIDGETRATIGATEQLISSLEQDLYLGPSLQQLVNQLQIPLIKEAIDDPTLLNNNQHPVRQLLESIGSLAPYSTAGSGGEGPLSDALREIGDACANGETSGITQVTEQIKSLLDQQKEVFERNLSLVVSSSEMEHELQQHGEKVQQLLTEKLAGQSISKVLDRLLQFGWPALLLQMPDNSGDWKAFVGVIDLMISSFAAEHAPEAMEPEEVENFRRILRNGFSAYPLHPQETAELTDQISHALEVGGETYRQLLLDRVVVDQAYLQDLFRQQIPDSRSPAPGSAPLADAVAMLPQLNTGDWIAERLQQGQIRLLNMAWRAPSSDRFVFVDGSGKKVMDCDAGTLAEFFGSQRYSQLETAELPLVERAVHRALKQSFSQVKSDIEVDQLTGLMNRKAFEQKISRLIRESTADSQHMLLLLDLDRFNMINDVCGFEGGDHLLQTATDILGAFLNSEGHLARTGDDEFGILIENCTLDKGYQIGESQRRAMEGYKFNWQGKSAPVSISLGLAAVHSDSTVARLMKSASSACSLAKSSGRNCSRVYQASEREFEEQRRLIKSVPVIEEALEKNRITLFSQLITPLFVGEENDHFEILLRVLDADGRPGSPEDFIRAAERYDRMRSIDRWVVNAFFSWLDSNSTDLDDIGGFSINLSGQSMNDAQIIDLLKQKICAAPISASKIGIEITETAMLSDVGKTNRVIEEVKRTTGCKFYLDDFGSGYASYAYLKDLSVDVVKVDGVFVRDMLNERSSHAMVKSIVDIAHYMDKKVIAEFAETEAQIIALRELDVDFAQGFGVGRPMPLQSITHKLAAAS